MERKSLIYTGKAKCLYETEDSTIILAEYLDQATALNGAKKDQIAGKGQLNNQITSLIFQRLMDNGVETHFIRQISKTEQLIKKVEIIPLEVVVRNQSAGSFAKRFQLAEGTKLDHPIIEFYLKNDQLDDPFINEDHVELFHICSKQEIIEIKNQAHLINQQLQQLFDDLDITLIDFKLEFGKDSKETILLADEISPDTCRLWDKKNQAHLDKDVYRLELGEIVPVYEEVLQRLIKQEKEQ